MPWRQTLAVDLSALRIHLDEDADVYAWLNALRQRGLDVTSSREQRLLGYPDVEQLVWAAANGRVIYSYNAADFADSTPNFSNTADIMRALLSEISRWFPSVKKCAIAQAQ